MKGIYSPRVMLLKYVTAARWLEQTATGHTVFHYRGHVLHTDIYIHTHTHTHLTNFKIVRSSKHIYLEKNT